LARQRPPDDQVAGNAAPDRPTGHGSQAPEVVSRGVTPEYRSRNATPFTGWVGAAGRSVWRATAGRVIA
jgi:hypothetical protein